MTVYTVAELYQLHFQPNDFIPGRARLITFDSLHLGIGSLFSVPFICSHSVTCENVLILSVLYATIIILSPATSNTEDLWSSSLRHRHICIAKISTSNQANFLIPLVKSF